MNSTDIDDTRISDIRSIIAPEILMRELPACEHVAEFVTASRAAVAASLDGSDDRPLVVVGPCSIHDYDQAVDYAARLSEEIKKHRQDLNIVMRVYFEKPRTTVGWKGFINDPDLDGKCEIDRGIHLARKLLLELNGKGIACGTEFLDVITPQYIADLVSWGAIGARTTESQVHRQLASGLSMPVGFKNGTNGNLQIAIDAIGAAHGSHHFLSVTKQGVAAIVQTTGNHQCHVILRGGREPNYRAEDIKEAREILLSNGLPPFVMVDCSHGNSLKDPANQPLVCDELARQIAAGEPAISGVMIESHIVAGNQSVAPIEELTYGQSITDACVDWDTTATMLETLAHAVRKRRQKG
jgi:3-deoxy-7-phosphoheptulonate synthase